MENPLYLQGWSRPRRVIVLRRRLQRAEKELTGGTERLLLDAAAPDPYEYVLLVTNADWDLAGPAKLHRERADSENTIDELKRQ
jgi:hypothetical protein